LFRNFFSVEGLIDLLYIIPIFLISLTVHEVAHAYTAWKMGDPTAKSMGRITLNPLKHIDPIGLLMLIIIRFGWAKPVQINPNNFKNPKKGMAISALAGPVSNLLMATCGAALLGIINYIYYNNAAQSITFVEMSRNFLYYFVFLNILLAVFNFLPVPPLDGSRIVTYFLPRKYAYYYNYVERYGFLILFIGLWTGILSKPLNFFIEIILNIIIRILNLLPFILL